MTLTLNKKDYLKLLEQTKIIPKIIETETEYEEYLAVAEDLIAKKDQRTLEETTLFNLLVKLIEDYEEQAYSLEDWSNLLPAEILQHLLEYSGTKQADLAGVIKASEDLISSLVNGQKEISKEQAKKLGIYFKVSPSLFISR
jgi:HTH-type transcriptional regulator/antitoxin HigA